MPTEDEILQTLRPHATNTALQAVAAKASEARDLELEIKDVEQHLKDLKSKLHSIYTVDLPNLMDAAHTDRVGLPTMDNLPAVDLKLTPYYRANIEAGWSPERRAAAFAALEELGSEDLIKTKISLLIPREERHRVAPIVDSLRQQGYSPHVESSVHWKTLSSWLQEQYERGNPVPPLETIGADVGRIVKLTERK